MAKLWVVVKILGAIQMGQEFQAILSLMLFLFVALS